MSKDQQRGIVAGYLLLGDLDSESKYWVMSIDEGGVLEMQIEYGRSVYDLDDEGRHEIIIRTDSIVMSSDERLVSMLLKEGERQRLLGEISERKVELERLEKKLREIDQRNKEG